MAGNAFTLILTKGTHLVSAPAADAIVNAIRNGDRMVEVELDLFGAGDTLRTTMLVIAHVVALTKNPLDEKKALQKELGSGKVRLLGSRF